MACRGEYNQWPFLTRDEFDLACAYFEQRYIQAQLGPTRKIFKIYTQRNILTGTASVEITRLLQLPEGEDDLLQQFEKLGREASAVSEKTIPDVTMAEDQDQEALRPEPIIDGTADPPQYSLYSPQPYVTYEIHLHPTYQMPTLWFTLHDLPNGESSLNIDSVFRYLVPEKYKTVLRSIGMAGGISAAHHPVTDVPAFFIHPCQTKEALECYDFPIDNYLMAWIGLVGGCVGLWIPSEMAMLDARRS